MLESQHSAVHEVARGFTGNVPDGRHAIRAGGEGLAGFETTIPTLQVRVVSGDIGRVADQCLEPTFKRSQPGAQVKLYFSGGNGLTVLLRYLQRRFAVFRCVDFTQGSFAGDGQRDGAATGAQVGNSPGGIFRNTGESRFYQ